MQTFRRIHVRPLVRWLALGLAVIAVAAGSGIVSAPRVEAAPPSTVYGQLFQPKLEAKFQQVLTFGPKKQYVFKVTNTGLSDATNVSMTKDAYWSNGALWPYTAWHDADSGITIKAGQSLSVIVFCEDKNAAHRCAGAHISAFYHAPDWTSVDAQYGLVGSY